MRPRMAAIFGILMAAGPVLAQEQAQDAVQDQAQDQGRLTVELNKLEQGDEGTCRAYFLFRNDTGMTFEGFESSLALMNSTGVIDRLVTVDAAPLPAGRTTLKLFEFPDIACTAISELLLYEVGTCQPQNRDPADCFALMDLVSKAAAPLVK